MITGPLTRLSRIMCDTLERHLTEGARPVVPGAGLILWRCFADMCDERRLGASGTDPISLANVMIWAALHQVPFEVRHVAVIRAMDRVWLTNARLGPQAKPLTPEGFDAIF